MNLGLGGLRAHFVRHHSRSSSDPIGSQRTALVLDPHSGRLVAQQIHPWTRLLAHLLAARLDRRLAGGALPESTRLLAARAQHLASPSRCLALAQSWEQVVRSARFPGVGPGNRIPLCHERINAAESDIRTMVSCLTGSSPVAVQGIAMLTILLNRGDGPLFSRGNQEDLNHAVLLAISALDPITSLQSLA